MMRPAQLLVFQHLPEFASELLPQESLAGPQFDQREPQGVHIRGRIVPRLPQQQGTGVQIRGGAVGRVFAGRRGAMTCQSGAGGPAFSLLHAFPKSPRNNS